MRNLVHTLTIMKSHQNLHIDEVVKVAQGLGSKRDALIQESWRRCVSNHNLDPTSQRDAYVLTSQSLRPHIDAMEEFLRTARVGLESLYRRVAGLGYVLLLTDAKGVTVDFIGDRALDKYLVRAGLCLGADWDEKHAGTCAVGTCIAAGEAITVHQTDHFDATHIPLTCSSAPIFDERGELAAVLDISALQSPLQKSSQYLTLEFAKCYAQRVESANLINNFRREWILKLSAAPEFADVDPDYLLALDGSGRIIGFNHSAQLLLAQEANSDWHETGQLLGRQFIDFFDCSINDLPLFVHSRPTEQRNIRLKNSDSALFAQILPPATNGLKSSVDVGELPIPEALQSVAGNDSGMHNLLSRAAKLMNTRMSLLINGETGTGKEYLAKALHKESVRAGKPFIAVNCAALPESLIESELFGYEAGSFTGASSKGKRGLILDADRGTLFLDEIGDMPMPAQARLLRVLAEKEVVPIGRSKPIPVDIRVIAATHRDLADRVKAGLFRDDLYFRLNGAVLTLPSLRQRADFDWLVEKLLRERGEQDHIRYFVAEPARTVLCAHSWPGNIRELINCLEYACAVARDGIISIGDLPDYLQHPGAYHAHLQETAPIVRLEAEQLRATLIRHHWNITAVARELKVHRSTVYRQMQQFGIPTRHFHS